MTSIKKIGHSPSPVTIPKAEEFVKAEETTQPTPPKPSTVDDKENALLSQKAGEEMLAQRKERAEKQVGAEFVKAPSSNVLANQMQKKLGGDDRPLDTGINLLQDGANALHQVHDKVVDTAQDIANKAHQGKDAVIDGAQLLAHQLHKAQDKVTDAAQDLAHAAHDVKDKAVDGAQDLAHDAHKAINKVVDFAQQFVPGSIGKIIDGAQDIANDIHKGVDKVIDKGQEADQALHKVADKMIDGSQVAHKLAHKLADKGIDGMQAADRKLHDVADKVIDGKQAFDKGIHDVANLAVDTLQIARGDALEKEIKDGLNSPGDKFTLALGGSVSVEGGKVTGKGTAEVTMTDDQPPRYQLAVSGDIAGGVAGEIGAKLGGKATASAEALLRAGGKVEMTFDTPKEAARAAEILGKQAIASAPGALPLVGPGIAVASQALMGPSLKEAEFLAKNISGLEVKGGAVAEISGALGLQLDKTLNIASISGNANISNDISAHIEFPKKNAQGEVTQGTQISFSQEYAGAIGGAGGLGIIDPTSQEGIGLGLGAGGELSGSITLGQTIELPKDVTAMNLVLDPVGTLGSVATKTKMVDNSATVSIRGEGGVLGTGGGREVTFSLANDPSKILNTDFAGKLFSGDIKGATQALGDSVVLEAKDESILKGGLKLNPELSVMGFGVGVEGELTHEDRTTQHAGQVSASQLFGHLQSIFSGK